MKRAILVIALSTILLPAFAATANWTGRMEPVITVTHQVAWNCEYNYAGQTFWRAFKGSCPYRVDVQ